MARPMGKTAKHRDFLKERIDTDKTLDCLLAKTILSKEEVDEVKSRPSMCQKNQKLLDYIIEKDNEDEFINTLGDANQQHLANYLLNDGVRNENKWNDWPLIPAKIQTIDVNYGSLKDLLDTGGGLLDKLIARRVISHRHKQLICSKATDSEKNETFLDILRRGSMADYENTIQCLQDSNQNHIAEILDEGGAVMRAHTGLREPLAEVRIVERITDLLRDRTVEESKRILEIATHKVIAAKIGDSIIFYFYCKTSESWQELKKAIRSGSLKVTIEKLCKRVDSQASVVIETFHILDDDQDKLDKYFAIKKLKGNRCFRVLLLLGILLPFIAIILGCMDHYATQTVPCWSKHVECQEVGIKFGVLSSVHDGFTLNFKQLQNATSALLQAAKESPNNDDLISLILKMYETPTEETKQKITERIRQLEKELTAKGSKSANRKKTIENAMQNVINLIGKVSLKVTVDFFQLAEDLRKLINDTLVTTKNTDEHDAEERDAEERDAEERDAEERDAEERDEEEESPYMHVVFYRIFYTITYFFPVNTAPRNSPLELPGPSETDKQETYEKVVAEKLTAVENSIQETVLILIEFIKETEGVNDLLRRILSNFQENCDDVCSETEDIKESTTRGYQELYTGMLRLTCLLDETVRMTRLARDLTAQAISLKEDVERIVEVNEHVKQSIPYLVLTLLTVTKREMPNKLMKPI